ncbi:type IV pilin protein [Cellulomonas sp. NPDC058312]|uniref:type IV pilin protein n=1 Tax=Cellulomonas sp. NPDC058312 TaxID=3346441 RepID=UPI0036F08BE9
MIARIHQAMAKKDDKGFTLIELLVVVIIIGILAAIAIPVFLNQRKSAVDAGIKSDLRTVANEVETAFVNKQAYPASVDSSGKTITLVTGTDTKVVNLSNANTTIKFTNGGSGTYTITGVNTTDGTGTTYTYDSSKGGLQP